MHLAHAVVARRLRAAIAIAPLLVLALTGTTANAEEATGFHQTNLVSDVPGLAATTDPHLVNPWGLVAGPASPWWISDNGTGLSTLYTGTGNVVPLVVTIPPPAGAAAGTVAGPDGIVFNGGTNFVVSNGTASGPAVFIFATEDGTIAGWNPGVNRTVAVKTVDNSAAGAVYKGLTTVTNAGSEFLLAANFHDNRIDVFDSTFKPVDTHGAFRDRRIPDGFAPFNVRAIGSNVFVTYAKQDAAKANDVAGRGNGFIDVFSTTGKFQRRFATRGVLNSPWGLVVAPKTFGEFGGALLVGNFGDGRIHAFDAGSGRFLGTLHNEMERPLVIDGLWDLQFGNGGAAGPTTTLFFTAGIAATTHGLFGTLTPVAGSS
jgi:uncharacterized protein (TIGR03118 family)